MQEFNFQLQRFSGSYIYNNYVSNTVVSGTAFDDTIKSLGREVTVYGGAGNDSIFSWRQECIINAGEGDDTIKLSDASDNKSVLGDFGKFSVILYEEGDGNDLIYNFSVHDTLQITSGNYSTVQSDSNIIVNVGEGSVTLLGGGTYPELNIVGGSFEGVAEKNDPYTINYSGENKTVSNYNGEKINWSADFTGFTFNDTDFILNSSTGSLTLQNASDDTIEIAVNNKTVAQVYMTKSDGSTIDRSAYSCIEVIIGGNNTSNQIIAGSGGSSLWGGSGGNDTLTGGAGKDNFFYGKNDGNDKIYKAGSSDIIYLYDVTLADILSANVTDNQISLNFNTGNNLQVNSTENLSSTFNLADGSWKYNHSSGSWQNA